MSFKYPIVVLISGHGSNLQAIIDASHQGAPYIIKAVISDKADAFGLERARCANIPTDVLVASDFVNRADYDKALQAVVTSYQPQLVVLAGFMRILTPEFVHHFANQIINIHPSLLPKFPGLNTHERAISAGEQWHGATVHVVTAELDAGPIIAQCVVAVRAKDTVADLQERVHKAEHKLYPIVIQWLAQARLHLREEGVYLDDQLLVKEGFRFNFNDINQFSIEN